jgi:hypothetical protein
MLMYRREGTVLAIQRRRQRTAAAHGIAHVCNRAFGGLVLGQFEQDAQCAIERLTRTGNASCCVNWTRRAPANGVDLNRPFQIDAPRDSLAIGFDRQVALSCRRAITRRCWRLPSGRHSSPRHSTPGSSGQACAQAFCSAY